MEAPICLIENTANGKFVVNPKAIDILSRFSQPAVVVAIVGLYRTGKSYLMNKLAGAQKGFNLGATIQAETKGIWMWCVPHPLKENHTLVLLDTEGLGDVEKGDSKNDKWIFTLAVLLSSTMVYNSKGTIDQDALDKLKFVGEFTELIKVKSKENDNEEAEFSRHFPSFVWAIRDFHLSLEIEGNKVSADKYLENAIANKEVEKTKKDKKYNDLRESIRMYFGNRKCFVFDFPTIDNKTLQTLENVADDKLNANFVTQCKEFCDYIWEKADTKMLNDTITVTGHRLGELAKIYTDAVSNSKFACMEDAVVSLAEKENKMAVQEAAQHFEDGMKKIVLPTKTLDDFLTQSSQYEEEARLIFMKRSFRDNNQQFLEEYLKNIHKKKEEFSAMNEEKSREVCRALIKKLSADFEKALKEATYHTQGGHAKFKEDLKAIETKYNVESGKGVKVEEVLQEFIKSQQSSEIIIIQEDNALNQKQKQEEEENARKKIVAMEEELKRLQEVQKEQKVEEERDNIQKTFDKLMEKMEEDRRIMNEKLDQVIRQKERNQQLYMDQGLPRHANMYQEQIKDIKQEQKEESGPAWYEPIVSTFKKVAGELSTLLHLLTASPFPAGSQQLDRLSADTGGEEQR
ncbi:PREDICTED: guanylate-binding protein 1-like [Nanorana parkeri]|uniref:guanylate-binding protein 1-like n=1 Tax=Nanorana parkeri TaxID=125878 RepID=UPI00085486D9|nr:PREDICTED: guanylate-binding protein 1-like [Nanorana parkeri]